MFEPLEILASPLFWTSMVIPGLIAGMLVALRWDKQEGFRAQSSSDFLVVPLTVDLGIAFFPDSFISTQGINLDTICTQGIDLATICTQGINLATTRGTAIIFAISTLLVLIWNVIIVERNLAKKPSEKSGWLLGWMACLTLVGTHAIHFVGLVP